MISRSGLIRNEQDLCSFIGQWSFDLLGTETWHNKPNHYPVIVIYESRVFDFDIHYIYKEDFND